MDSYKSLFPNFEFLFAASINYAKILLIDVENVLVIHVKWYTCIVVAIRDQIISSL